MTPSDQHADQQLTRRQLREIRMTGATPVVTPEAAAEALAQSAATPPQPEPTASPAVETQAEPPAESPVAEKAPSNAPAETPAPLHLPRAAEPLVDSPAPVADAAVDLGVRARTRRQARDQERIRTNSIPVLAPETELPVVAEPAADAAFMPPAGVQPLPTVSEVEPEGPAESAEPVAPASSVAAAVEVAPEPAAPIAVSPEPVAPVEPPVSQWAPRAATGSAPIPLADPAESEASIAATMQPAVDDDEAPAQSVRADFGANLLAQGETFDDLLIRSSTSSGRAGSASTLILPEDVSLTPLTAPVTSTGQVILTGTFALPDGLGSQGHAPGIADGKDVDAVLIDGELAPQSSPTPIAATAAVSQAKTPVEMIRPPAPEKSSKLVVALAITAGLLSLAAIGFTIYVVTTGKF